ncbi:MAG: SHOCT domain-containing protein [Acidimicrobiales bacterium]|jgi:hypothetical protein|nr:SHOCT domain-containing protein [Acidimicrobiales bacterium]
MLFAETTFGDVVLWTLTFFFFFMWIWVFISCISDLFRDHQESGVSKVLWTIFLVFFPILGPLVYLLVRGKGMAERSMKQQAAVQQQFDDYVRQTAGSGPSAADELAKLADLKASGAISEDDYQKMKAKVVG